MFDGEDDQWREQAACKGKPIELWFPVKITESGKRWAEESRAVEGKRICSGCPVLEECRAWAIGFDVFPLVGVFGGMTSVERELAYRDAEAGRTPLLEAS